jgi:hypothetical protein
MKLFYYIILFTYIIATSLTVAQITLTAGPVSCEYKTKDLDAEYDPNTDVSINCNGNSCNVNGSGATSSNGIVTISAAGTYIVKGTLNGQVRIEATKEDFVHLVLNSVSISSRNGPAIYGVAASKVVITLVGDNTLTDSNNYTTVEDEPDACLFIDSDLAINGQGSINVTANYSDAIRCKKDLKLISGKITVPKANKRGIKARNSICILDAVIDVTSNDTAIKATRDNDPEKGFVVIDGGKITIKAGKDGIHAETHITIRDGYIDIKKSVEGIEGQMVDILGGEIHVLATNDGINAGKISTGEKSQNPFADFGAGNDGSVYINIVGGKTYVDAQGSDLDGIDANGVLYIGGNAEVYSSVSSGTIFGFYAAYDSDGANTVLPGATVVGLATQSGTGGGFWKRSVDYVKRHVKRQWGGGQWGGQQPGQGGQQGGQWGGQQPGQGGQQGGQQGGWGGFGGGGFGGGGFGGFGGFGNDPGVIYQPYIQTNVQSQPANSKLVVKDKNGNIIINYNTINPFSTILVTSPKMVAGETYTITAGNSSSTAVASAAATGKESVKPPSVTEPPEKVPITTKTKTKTNKPQPTGSQTCSSSITKQGYPCCSANCVVVYTDNDGDWGVENNQWCGCGGGEPAPTCPEAITSQGYSCCSENNCSVQYTDASGKWGVENNNWCGILSSC